MSWNVKDSSTGVRSAMSAPLLYSTQAKCQMCGWYLFQVLSSHILQMINRWIDGWKPFRKNVHSLMVNWPPQESSLKLSQKLEVLCMSHSTSTQYTVHIWTQQKGHIARVQNQIHSHQATSNETLYLCGFENDSVHWCLTTVTRMK